MASATMIARWLRHVRQPVLWLAMVLGLLATTPGGVAAEDSYPGTVSVSKAEYIEICEETGGGAYEQDDGSVTCFYEDGSWSNCEFETNTCEDHFGIGPRPGPDLTAPPAGNAPAANDSLPPPAIDTIPGGDHTAVDGDRPRDKAKHKKGKGKKRGHGGKAHKR